MNTPTKPQALVLFERALLLAKSGAPGIMPLYHDTCDFLSQDPAHLYHTIELIEQQTQQDGVVYMPKFITYAYWADAAERSDYNDIIPRLLDVLPRHKHNDFAQTLGGDILKIANLLQHHPASSGVVRSLFDYVGKRQPALHEIRALNEQALHNVFTLAQKGRADAIEAMADLLSNFGLETLNKEFTSRGCDVLSELVFNGHSFDTVHFMNGEDNQDIESVDRCGQVIQMLCQHGADLEAKFNKESHTLTHDAISALHMAGQAIFHDGLSNHGHTIIAALIRAGADWQRALDATPPIHPAARELILQDPYVRAQRLTQVASAAQPSTRSKPAL